MRFKHVHVRTGMANTYTQVAKWSTLQQNEYTVYMNCYGSRAYKVELVHL